MTYTTLTRTLFITLLLIISFIADAKANNYNVTREFGVSVEVSPPTTINTASIDSEINYNESINFTENLDITSDETQVLGCFAEETELKIQNGNEIITIPVEITSDCNAVIIGDNDTYIPENVDVNLLLAELQLSATYL